MQKAVVIVGAGQAGAQVAQSLRQGGFEGPIRMIGDEAYPPYQRPPLSKKYLLGEMAEDGLFLRPSAFYEAQSIDLIPGVRVSGINRSAKRLTLQNGDTLDYGKLVLATGTRARPLPLPGADLEGVLSLRSIGDVQSIRQKLADAKRLVIVGAGYIGLEVAAVAQTLGVEVTVLEAADRPLKRVVSPIISAFYTQLHTLKGVTLRLETGVQAIEGDAGKVSGVRVSDAEVVAADLVLVAIGALPNDDLAEAAGLDVDNGILVDGAGQTSDEDIYACGDCTRFFSTRYERSVRMESVQNAIDQAKIVAQSLIGVEVDYDPLPWFWSDQYHTKLQIAGLSEGYDDTKLVGDPGDDKFYVAYLFKNKLIAVDSVNTPRSHMMARRVIGEQWRDGLLPAV
ncbi:FAD-dependent oxidoreductase [Roseibium sp. CAU 1637]|uniref:FAD-dependent oxidoreductase n=1 Tax=Roseibium limicola TaxID=2816037 RepID=A0A939ES30_9HYPH|nr:FAD-dependent oxidoreductase [Roseibium limicola]MBO0346563.1 FAD-dependent oxidoreductase [Roseibium limicola]